MRWRLTDLLTKNAEPLPPGPRGRILFVGPFQGGVGGVERLTRCFADWVRDSGYTATMVFEHTQFPIGPYTVAPSETVQVLGSGAWSRRLAEAAYDFVYIMPSGLGRRRWLPRLRQVKSRRVVLDLDPKRKYLEVTDVLHCESPRDEALPRPHVTAMPDPRPTIPDATGSDTAGSDAPIDAYFTAFTPYGAIKGHDRIPAFLDGADKALIWCYDPITFARRKRRYGKQIEAYVDELRAHPNLEVRLAPSREELYGLYRRTAGYVCFSRSETLGFSMLDAVALGKPLCAERVGVCRALADFAPTTDFGAPIFRTYPMPETLGYEGLAQAVAAMPS